MSAINQVRHLKTNPIWLKKLLLKAELLNRTPLPWESELQIPRAGYAAPVQRLDVKTANREGGRVAGEPLSLAQKMMFHYI